MNRRDERRIPLRQLAKLQRRVDIFQGFRRVGFNDLFLEAVGMIFGQAQQTPVRVIHRQREIRVVGNGFANFGVSAVAILGLCFNPRGATHVGGIARRVRDEARSHDAFRRSGVVLGLAFKEPLCRFGGVGKALRDLRRVFMLNRRRHRKVGGNAANQFGAFMGAGVKACQGALNVGVIGEAVGVSNQLSALCGQ